MIDWTSAGVKPNIEAERSVIGAILIDAGEVMPECVSMLSVDDFLISEYRALYRTMSSFFMDAKSIDFVTMCAAHGDDYKAIMGVAVQATPSVSAWKMYAQIVADTAKRKRAYESVETLIESLSANESVQDCQNLAVKACEQLSETKSDSAVSAKEGFYQFYTSLQKPADYIRTGFANLDRHAHICRGDFAVIGARPSVGKTALTLQMLMHMSKSHKVVYFSLETRNNNLFGRMAANVGAIDLRAIKTRDGLDWQRLSQTWKCFDDLNFHTVEAAGWTVPQIKAKAVQLGAEVIFIDYIGLIKSNGKDRYEKITNISVDLHTIAQQSNITVFALSQLSRAGQGEPTIETLRESGQIEQDADIILLLHAPDGIEESTRKIIIAKNKEGSVGALSFNFNGAVQRFTEIEEYRHE